MKVDRSELEALNDLKSNKNDTDLAMKGIDILHNQVLHIIVIVIEFVKASLATASDNEKAR
jgi:hypothetical protein